MLLTKMQSALSILCPSIQCKNLTQNGNRCVCKCNKLAVRKPSIESISPAPVLVELLKLPPNISPQHTPMLLTDSRLIL